MNTHTSFARPHPQWPTPDYDSMVKFYGEVGMHMVRLNTPYPLKLAWNLHTEVNSITVHERVAESMHRVMSTILILYGREHIQRLKLDRWGGCLNVRKKRGSTTSWSIHSWGAANDWHPSGNRLRTPWARAEFSDPVYIPFFNAWIAQGWNPLGLSWGRDAMHIEATANTVQMLEVPDHWDGSFD